MKTLTISLLGASKYYANSGFLRVIQEFSKWDEEKASAFIKKNDVIHLNRLDGGRAKVLLTELEVAGFELDLSETKQGFQVSLNLSYETEVDQIRRQVGGLVERIEKLEQAKNSVPDRQEAIVANRYASFIESKLEEGGGEESKVSVQKPKAKRGGATEANIGQYWLSRIGVFTLLLGVVFLVSYSSQYFGAWGKLMMASAIGLLLVGGGNALALKKNYFKWAMAAIGGGWAILFFVFFAAYHVPAVKVIEHPLLGLVFLMGVSVLSIGQSLQFKSYVLVIMSYLLAFIAMVTTGVTFYTLIASFLLAASMVIITRKLGWNWLACLGLAVLYITHWVWLEPSISFGLGDLHGGESILDALYLPLAGSEWKIYPVINLRQSLLHLSFLSLYWLLFTAMDLFRPSRQEKTDRVTPWLAVSNSLIFFLSVLHHLHVYYPPTKCVFTLVMALVFLAYAFRVKRLGDSLFSNVYLGLSVSLGALVIPMAFDGSSVTYGWAAASVLLVWLSFRNNQAILRSIAYGLLAFVVIRIICFDYLETKPIFSQFSINPFFFTALFSGLAAGVLYKLFVRASGISEKEKRVAINVSLISFATLLTVAVLMGGQREIASFVAMLFGGFLLLRGVGALEKSQRIAGALFILIASIRFIEVDFEIPLKELALSPMHGLRYAGGVLAGGLLLVLGERIRKHTELKALEAHYFVWAGALTGLFYLSLVTDKSTEAYQTILWGAGAFAFLLFGFNRKEKAYRWIGLAGFVLVLFRLFTHDFAQLEMISRILSFMGLGVVLIVASLIYSHYAKKLEESD